MSGSLPRRDFARFEKSLKNVDTVFMSYDKDLLLSIVVKFETTVFLGMPRDFRVFHNSFGFQRLSQRFSSKNGCFIAAINLSASYLAFLYNFLLICSLDFLNTLKSLPFDLGFSSTSQ